MATKSSGRFRPLGRVPVWPALAWAAAVPVVAVLLMAPPPPAGAAPIEFALVGQDGRSVDQIPAGRFDPLVQRVQKALAEGGLYQGTIDGRMNVETREAIRLYQKRNNLAVDGEATESLAAYLETGSKVGVLLQRLEQARGEDKEAARQALLKNPLTRGLVITKEDPIADPTRDTTQCFRNPSIRCLLTEAAESSKAIFRADMRDWALGEILAAQAKAGFAEEAMATVRRIQDPRLIMVALRDIAEALAATGRGEEALAAAVIIPEILKRAEALAAIAAIQAKRGDQIGARATTKRLIEVANELPNLLRRVTFITRAAVALTEVGDRADGQAVLDKGETVARSQVAPEDRGSALRYIAAALADMGQPERALKVVNEVPNAADRTPVLVAAATAQAAAGDATQALATADGIEAVRYRAVVLSQIAIASARAGDRAGARDIVRKARIAANEIEFPYARGFAVSRVALALAEVAKADGVQVFEESVEAARQIGDDQLRAHILWTIAAERRRAGDGVGAARTEALAREASEAIKSPLSRIWMFGDISASQIAAGDAAAAWNAFRSALDAAETVQNAWARARALSKLAATLNELTRLAEAAARQAK